MQKIIDIHATVTELLEVIVEYMRIADWDDDYCETKEALRKEARKLLRQIKEPYIL